tara:strand:+ start:1170 stop:1556 length:387 start_codon:yes stop_codon:yes gene_type:complete
MRDLIRYIKSVVKKQEPEEPQEDETSEFSSGAMKLSWEASTGDFEVDFLIDDLSDGSVETLALLLYYLEKGDLNKFILQSLKYRTQEIDKEFYAKVLLHWASLDNQDMESTQEEPIVGPSQVFSFKHR